MIREQQRKEIQKHLHEMETSLMDKGCQIDELESEIDDILRRRVRYLKRYRMYFTDKKYAELLQAWPRPQ